MANVEIFISKFSYVIRSYGVFFVKRVEKIVIEFVRKYCTFSSDYQSFQFQTYFIFLYFKLFLQS
jgi:hypothetical protein